MAIHNRYVVLYWVRGLMPTQDQVADSRQYGPHVAFRNALYHTEGSTCEPCTAVTGDVPRDYAVKYPAAIPYMDWLAGKLPAIEAAPTPGQLAIGDMTARPFAARVLAQGEGPPRRGTARRTAVDGDTAMEGMTGVDSAISLPPPPPGPPPPPPSAGRSTTPPIELPPPPPPPPGE